MDGQIPGPAKVLRAPSLKRGKPEERITDRVSSTLSNAEIEIIVIIRCNDLHVQRERPCYFRDVDAIGINILSCSIFRQLP